MVRSKSGNSLTTPAKSVGGGPWGWAALLAVSCAGVWRDAAILMRHPIAVGVDGYYYVLQVEALWNQHRLLYPSAHPLVLYALAGVRFVTSDTVLAVKVVVVAFHLALCVGVFALVKAFTRSHWAGVLGAALTAASGLHLYFIVEFINNLGAVVFLVWGGWALIRFRQTRGRVHACVAIVLIAAAAFSHRSALPLTLVLAALILFLHGLERTGRAAPKRWGILLLIFISWSLPAVFGAVAFDRLPAWLQGELSPVPRWPWGRYSVAEAVILLIAAPTALMLLSRREPESRRLSLHVVGAVALLTLTFTLNPFIRSVEVWGGVAERLRALAYIQVAILVPAVTWMLSVSKRSTIAPYPVALVLPLLIVSNTAPTPPGLRPEYIQHRAQMMAGLRALMPEIDPASIIVAPHGDQFVVTAVTGVASQQRVPDQAAGRRVYWVVRQMTCHESESRALALTSDGAHLCTVLIEDRELRQRAKLLNPVDKRRVLALNPHIRGVPGLMN